MRSNAALDVIEVFPRREDQGKGYQTCGNIIYLSGSLYQAKKAGRSRSKTSGEHKVFFKGDTRAYLTPGYLQLLPLLMAVAYLTGSCLSAWI